ncbi:MAG: hypothetical protein V3T87_01180 [Candidatus Thorarchaeota archaeon]
MPDGTTRWSLKGTAYTDDDHKPIEMEAIGISDDDENIKEIVIAGVLASLSIAVAPLGAIVPRVPGWGIAIFDPVSIRWIVAFLIGGFRVGSVSMTAGTFGLFFYDPTGVGPIFKFLATAPMIVVPWLAAKKFSKTSGGKYLVEHKAYAGSMFVAFLVRLGLMIPLNLVVVPILVPGFFTAEGIIIYTLILNTVQSFWDALIPYVVAYKTPVYDNFGMW